MYARPYGYTADNSHPGVPLRIEPSQDPLPRASVGDVYIQILDDLNFAADNLPVDNGVYATQDAARAYLSQVYFLMGNYTEAASFASDVINSGRYTLDEDLDRFETDVINLRRCSASSACRMTSAALGSATTFAPTTTPARNWPSATTSLSS